MKIAMVASESNPLVKVGGLGDVVYSLSKELTIMGEEVIIVLPFYQTIKEYNGYFKVKKIATYDVNLSWRHHQATVYRTYIDGIAFYLIDNAYYFDRPNTYGYDDDGERFAFFTIAARNMFESINFKPDVIHVHDWQAAMLPCLIKEQNKNNPFFKDIKFVFTIHNPAFQGIIDKYFIYNFYELSDELYDNGKLRYKDKFNPLKAAIVYSDKITTVSPTHRCELLSKEGSMGLSDILETRKNDFVGILNGIDYGEFDPQNDPRITKHYGTSDVFVDKKIDKDILLKRFNLENNGQLVFGLVSRLTFQKGINLALDAMKRILDNGDSVIVLGSGEYGLTMELERLRSLYPTRMGLYIGYSNDVAHMVYAGSEFFLMPSLFEPCGIGQMIAERYGSLPIVRETGGLADSVIGYNGNNHLTATGISFKDFDYGGMMYGIDKAYELYNDKKKYKRVVLNAMKIDHSWANSANKYLDIYKGI